MNNILYIIGNGFDKHHKLKTGYCDYFHFLEEKCPDLLDEMNSSKFFGGLDREYPEESDEKKKDEFWSVLEKDLEYAYEDHLEETIDYYAPDLTSDHPDFGAVMHRVKDGMSPFFKFTGDLFVEWIMSIDVSKCIRDNDLNLSPKSFYLTFNYTNTLQSVYGILEANILHIHGSLKEALVNGELLQFGNPDVSAERLKKRLENKYADHPCGSWVTDAIPCVVDLCSALTKNLKQNYGRLRKFLRLKNFNEVVVMGHSFMGVDRPYYDDVIVPCLEKCKWKFFYHNDDDRANVQKFKQAHPTICVDEEHW